MKIHLEASNTELLEVDVELSQIDFCTACGIDSEVFEKFVDEGIVEPIGSDPQRWLFAGISVSRARLALRLKRDLGVNTAGAALALELLNELRYLRRAPHGDLQNPVTNDD